MNNIQGFCPEWSSKSGRKKKAKSLGFYSNWRTFYRLFFGVLDHLYLIFQLCEWPSFFSILKGATN